MDTTRREFMVGAAGLTFGLLVPGCVPVATRGATATLATGPGDAPAFSPWVSIAPGGTVYIQSPAVEMGQGSLTSLPLIIAEELDADWSKVRVVPAPPDDKLYGNPGFGGTMLTAGSNAVRRRCLQAHQDCQRLFASDGSGVDPGRLDRGGHEHRQPKG